MFSSPCQVLGWIELPGEIELESHPIPPSLGQNQQWWPEQEPPSTTFRYHQPMYTFGMGPTPTTPPPKQYSLPNCREFLGRRIR